MMSLSLCGYNSQDLLQSSKVSVHFFSVSVLIAILQVNSQTRHTPFSQSEDFMLRETEPKRLFNLEVMVKDSGGRDDG